eukprot:TRINITY_DN5069_c0_g1_i4.p1 TRINITY_DN5069_c0_g1~~TRINITY_DN5069_c0_g1_i4.p1  ORF type:complete len:665 (-),score=44.22 TRINITY_DN5069_c0_g1_i4:152-2146(-)
MYRSNGHGQFSHSQPDASWLHQQPEEDKDLQGREAEKENTASSQLARVRQMKAMRERLQMEDDGAIPQNEPGPSGTSYIHRELDLARARARRQHEPNHLAPYLHSTSTQQAEPQLARANSTRTNSTAQQAPPVRPQNARQQGPPAQQARRQPVPAQSRPINQSLRNATNVAPIRPQPETRRRRVPTRSTTGTQSGTPVLTGQATVNAAQVDPRSRVRARLRLNPDEPREHCSQSPPPRQVFDLQQEIESLTGELSARREGSGNALVTASPGTKADDTRQPQSSFSQRPPGIATAPSVPVGAPSTAGTQAASRPPQLQAPVVGATATAAQPQKTPAVPLPAATQPQLFPSAVNHGNRNPEPQSPSATAPQRVEPDCVCPALAALANAFTATDYRQNIDALIQAHTKNAGGAASPTTLPSSKAPDSPVTPRHQLEYLAHEGAENLHLLLAALHTDCTTQPEAVPAPETIESRCPALAMLLQAEPRGTDLAVIAAAFIPEVATEPSSPTSSGQCTTTPIPPTVPQIPPHHPQPPNQPVAGAPSGRNRSLSTSEAPVAADRARSASLRQKQESPHSEMCLPGSTTSMPRRGYSPDSEQQRLGSPGLRPRAYAGPPLDAFFADSGLSPRQPEDDQMTLNRDTLAKARRQQGRHPRHNRVLEWLEQMRAG